MYTRTLFFVFILFIFSCSKSSTDDETPKVIVNTIEETVSDMQGSHEAPPFGVPLNFTWQAGPRIGLGNDPGSFRAMLPWGQVLETTPGNTSTNTRIEIRNLKAYYLNKRTNTWQLWIQAAKPSGIETIQDLSINQSKAADIRDEPGGSMSVKMEDGYNFYFFSPLRATIVPADIAGVFVTVQARLILHDASKTDDRDAALFLLSAAGDYWLDLSAQSNNFNNNGDIAIGKFKRVTKNWRAFNMHTLSADELRKNPPPME